MLGSSVYHVGQQAKSWSQNQELDVLSHAMAHARELAMSRMQFAKPRGWARTASSGCGSTPCVTTSARTCRNSSRSALRSRPSRERATAGEAGGTTKASRLPRFFSGQDFCALIRAGYAPLGLVAGSCVYHIAHQAVGNAVSNIGRNVELESFTAALYDARELAMTRIDKAAKH